MRYWIAFWGRDSSHLLPCCARGLIRVLCPLFPYQLTHPITALRWGGDGTRARVGKLLVSVFQLCLS